MHVHFIVHGMYMHVCTYTRTCTCVVHIAVFVGRNELSAEEEEQRALAKRKMLGNIKFVGELHVHVRVKYDAHVQSRTVN